MTKNGILRPVIASNSNYFPVTKKSPPAKKPEVAGYDARQAPINAKLGHDELIQLYRDMVRIRRFEERCLRSYQQGKIGGFLHLYIGQ